MQQKQKTGKEKNKKKNKNGGIFLSVIQKSSDDAQGHFIVGDLRAREIRETTFLASSEFPFSI